MSEDHDDFAFEPIPGLPDTLPKGETLLWQGSPEWRPLARTAFHVRKVAAYFALLFVWQLAAAEQGTTAADMLVSSLWLAAVAAAALGILCLLAFLYARGTIYTLTTKRVVMRSGLALPVTFNMPLALVETASVSRLKGKAGSIALKVTKPNRVAYLVLWPNARPWNLSNPQPMLRCLPDVETVSRLLARTLVAEAGEQGVRQRAHAASPLQNEPAGMPGGRTVAA